MLSPEPGAPAAPGDTGLTQLQTRHSDSHGETTQPPGGTYRAQNLEPGSPAGPRPEVEE